VRVSGRTEYHQVKRQETGGDWLAGEPVSERSPEPLHAALGLGRASQDELDPELVEEAGKLGWLPPAIELLLQAELSALGLEEDAMPVRIDGQGHVVALHRRPQHLEVALRILSLDKAGPGTSPVASSIPPTRLR